MLADFPEWFQAVKAPRLNQTIQAIRASLAEASSGLILWGYDTGFCPFLTLIFIYFLRNQY
jgi:hypothetical protein